MILFCEILYFFARCKTTVEAKIIPATIKIPYQWIVNGPIWRNIGFGVNVWRKLILFMLTGNIKKTKPVSFMKLETGLKQNIRELKFYLFQKKFCCGCCIAYWRYSFYGIDRKK